MRVVVQKVTRDASGCRRVVVDTAAGSAEFVLVSSHAVRVGQFLDVEFAIKATLVREQNVRADTSARGYRLSSSDNTTTLVGQVDGVDDDGLTYLRLGPDALVMIDATSGAFDVGEWLEISLPMEQVELRPFGS